MVNHWGGGGVKLWQGGRIRWMAEVWLEHGGGQQGWGRLGERVCRKIYVIKYREYFNGGKWSVPQVNGKASKL